MKKISLITKSMLIAMGLIGIVHADNSNWTGPYVGASAGIAFNNAQLTAQQLGFNNSSGSYSMNSNYYTISPGLQLGFIKQFQNSWVSGVEVNASVNDNQKNKFTSYSPFSSAVYDRFIFRNQMQTSIKGRIGRAQNWNKNLFLPYLTAGASAANVDLTYKNEGGNYYTNRATQIGWLVGAGIEWAFMSHWSLRAEYNYLDYGSIIQLGIPVVYGLEDTNGNAKVNLHSNNLGLSLNYWI